MLNRIMECLFLYGVPAIGTDGREERAFLSEIRGTIVPRSAEETEEEDLDRAVQTVYAVIPKRYTPAGGFCRGMEILAQDGGRYRVLTPVLCGGFWSLKCSRTWL